MHRDCEKNMDSLKNTRKYHIHIPKKDVLEPVNRTYYVRTKDFTVEFATKIELYDWLQRHPESNFEGCVYVKQINKLVNI